MRRTVDRVCDLCKSEDSVSRYRVQYVDEPSGYLTADLCKRHKKFMEMLREKIHPKGGRRTGPREREVATPSQVRKARTRAKKKAPQSED